MLSSLQIPSFGSILLIWFLIGAFSGFVIAIAAILSVVASKELRAGVTVVISETLLEGLGDRKDVFLSNLQGELIRRGIIARMPLETGCDLVYRGFFNEVRISALAEGPHLRYGFRITATNRALALGIVFLALFAVAAVAVFVIALLRQNSLRSNLRESAEAAALLCRDGAKP